MTDILEEFGDIIETIEFTSTIQRYGFEFTKIRLRLIDGSSLRIWEKRFNKSLQRYSYYWLDELNKQIIGWDNAPHHSNIASFPHHKHVEDKILPSKYKLIDVFRYIASRLRDK
ncbi:MAG: hypothetical protein FVQ77_01270 [Cytophagales bacterium]|nr:hypothetical protein [Cytophagales bacterium]